MKRQVSPAVAVVVIVLVLLAVAGVYWWATEGRIRSGSSAEPPPIPADVQAEFQRRMGGVTPGGPPGGLGGGAPTAPTGR